MGDPRPPSAGDLGLLLDEIDDLRRRVSSLESPSGTQRGLTADKTTATLAYLAGLQSYGSVGTASATLSAQPADGTVRWFTTAVAPNNHVIGPVYVPTGRMLVTASVGEASMTPADGFMIAYVSFRVNDAAGKAVVATGARTGRLYFNQRIGQGISTGPSLVNIDSAQFAGPFTITPLIGIWGQNTGSGQAVSCVYNNPSLRVEIIGDGVY